MGFMGWPYGGPGLEDPGSSEMSWSNNYSNIDCKSTEQWRSHAESCWDWVQKQLESFYGGYIANIRMPNERYLPPGNNYFDGPNNDLDHPDYDVGALVVFPNTPAPPTTSDRPAQLSDSSGNALAYTEVSTSTTVNLPTYGQRRFYVDQGRTNRSEGLIWLLGVLPNDTVRASGKIQTTFGKSAERISAEAAATDFSWSYGAWQLGPTPPDTLHFTTRNVVGVYPLICGASLNPTALTINLFSNTGFHSDPTIDYMSDVDTTAQASFVPNSTGYQVNFSNYSGDEQTLEVHAPDDADSVFFFDNDYKETEFSDTLSAYAVIGPDGSGFLLDSTVFVTRAGVLSSPYPVIRTGLDTIDFAVSRTHALTLLPTQTSLPGSNQITIEYDLNDVPPSLLTPTLEASIRIFRWNEISLMWEMVGGDVDTTANQVSTAITKDGVYAAFSTDVATGIDNPPGGGDLPANFSLEQNYPNPFNPTTTIEFALPRSSHVVLTIYNIVGQRVRELINGTLSAGIHRIVWDGRGLNGVAVSSGVYFYQISTDRNTEARKMLLLK